MGFAYFVLQVCKDVPNAAQKLLVCYVRDPPTTWQAIKNVFPVKHYPSVLNVHQLVIALSVTHWSTIPKAVFALNVIYQFQAVLSAPPQQLVQSAALLFTLILPKYVSLALRLCLIVKNAPLLLDVPGARPDHLF
jgi:hypothetical protein